MIRFDDVYKQYAKSDDNALNGISLEVMRGEFVYLVGASGSGKSTFLRLVLREETPSKGKVWVAGTDVGRIRSWKVPALRRKIGVVFQDFRLLPNKTVYQNVAFALQVLGKSGHVIQQTVPATLELVGLQGKAKRMPHELSGGEQQRVAIARACVNRPAILLADEPTGNLDPDTSEGIMALLDRINRTQQTTVVMATHDANIVNTMRRRVLELKQGDLVRDEADGTYLDTVRKLNDGVAGRSPIARIVESGAVSASTSGQAAQATGTETATEEAAPVAQRDQGTKQAQKSKQAQHSKQASSAQQREKQETTPAGLPAPVPADVSPTPRPSVPAAADVLSTDAADTGLPVAGGPLASGHFAMPESGGDAHLTVDKSTTTTDGDTDSDEMDYLGHTSPVTQVGGVERDQEKPPAASQSHVTLPVAPDAHGFDGEDFTTTEVVSTSIRPGDQATTSGVTGGASPDGPSVRRHVSAASSHAEGAELLNVPGAEQAKQSASDGPPSVVGGAFAAAGLAADQQLPRPSRVDRPATDDADTPKASDLLPRPRGPQDDEPTDQGPAEQIALNDETHNQTAAGRD